MFTWVFSGYLAHQYAVLPVSFPLTKTLLPPQARSSLYLTTLASWHIHVAGCWNIKHSTSTLSWTLWNRLQDADGQTEHPTCANYGKVKTFLFDVFWQFYLFNIKVLATVIVPVYFNE